MSCELTLEHFSHPHQLQLSYYQESKNDEPSTCSVCERGPKDWICTCKTCNYLIHFQCSQIPIQIHHPFHRAHSLSLLSKPPYQSGSFTCSACSKQGYGFCYSCTDCKDDIHILCAAMPQHVRLNCHDHTLSLFTRTYDKDDFVHSCNICRGNTSNQWVYLCYTCAFEAHLGCTIPEPTIAGSSSTDITGKGSKKNKSSNSTPIKVQNLYPGGISSDKKKGGSSSTQAMGKKENAGPAMSNETKKQYPTNKKGGHDDDNDDYDNDCDVYGDNDDDDDDDNGCDVYGDNDDDDNACDVYGDNDKTQI